MQGSAEQSSLHLLGIILTGAMAIFMVNLDTTVVNIILPALSDKFALETARVSLVVISYLLALTGTALMFGRLSDLKCPEHVFISGYLVFSLGSLLCVMSWDLWSLVVFRFVQGLGGAMIFATSAVIVMRYIPSHLRGRAYAVNGMMAGIGFALGSPIGGFLAHTFNWRMVFLVNIPIGLLGLFLCAKFLTRRDHAAEKKPFDVWGAVSSFLALAVLVYTLQSVSNTSLFSTTSLSGLGVALLIGSVFVVLERKRQAPLLDLSIFRNRFLNFALAGTACYYVLLQGTSFILPFFLIKAKGLTEMQTGNILFVGPIMTIALSPVAGWLCDRVGAKIPCLIGSILFIISVLLFLNFDISTSIAVMLVTLVIFGAALSFYSAPILTLTMSHARPETLGILSSVKAVIPSIVGMLGVGLFATTYSHAQSAVNIATAKASQTGFHAAMYLALAVALVCLVCTLLTRSSKS